MIGQPRGQDSVVGVVGAHDRLLPFADRHLDEGGKGQGNQNRGSTVQLSDSVKARSRTDTIKVTIPLLIHSFCFFFEDGKTGFDI
jgi:hypothetical protein